MAVPEAARSWAQKQRVLLELGSIVDKENSFEHSNSHAWSYVLGLAAKRISHMPVVSPDLAAILGRTWIEEGDGGFVTARLYPIGGEFAVLTDRGLVDLLKLGGQLISRHYGGSSFELEHCEVEQRIAFARINTTVTGQLFLRGRLSERLPPLEPKWAPVADRVLGEAMLFVLAHELGHAIALGEHLQGTPHWLDEGSIPSELRDVAAEVEADGFAVAVVFSDVLGAAVGDSEVLLRLMAVRLVLQVLESAERASLATTQQRHLPAERRWGGIRSYLGSVMPTWLLERFEDLWDIVRRPLTITEALGPELLLDSPMAVGVTHGWLTPHTEDPWWQDVELQVGQFRLPTTLLEVLIGTDAASFLGETDLRNTLALGRKAVADLLPTLPPWTRGADPRGRQAGSGELINYLRKRDRWPHPFSDGAPLPIHLMASAVHRSVRGPLPRLEVL